MKLSFWKSHQEVRRIDVERTEGWMKTSLYEVPDVAVERWRKALAEFDKVQKEMRAVVMGGGK